MQTMHSGALIKTHHIEAEVGKTLSSVLRLIPNYDRRPLHIATCAVIQKIAGSLSVWKWLKNVAYN